MVSFFAPEQKKETPAGVSKYILFLEINTTS